ncbi:MAG: lysylphosphatidylglycerol synthase transmembrane domain-containing protein [Promethearchaeota archaeon]
MAEIEEVAAVNQVENESSDRRGMPVSIPKLVVLVLIAMIVYLVFAFISDFDRVATAISTIEWWVLPAMMSLSLLNYLFRYVKWQYYLDRIDVKLFHSDSFGVFLAGFTLTVSPGKIGEAIKGYFINEIDGTPIAKTVPVVVAERITDLLAMVLLAMIGFAIGFTGDQLATVLILGGMVLAGAIFLGQPRFYNFFLRKMTSFGPLKRFQDSSEMIEDTLAKTLSPKPMVFASAVSIPGWFMECIELWLLLSILSGAGLPSLTVASLTLLLSATFIHSTASVIGALVFTPGGLVGYEVTAGILIPTLVAVSAGIAAAAVILIRFVTLWFSVIVGFVALGVITRKRRTRKSDSISSGENS